MLGHFWLHSFVLIVEGGISRGLEVSLDFIKWRGGNKMTYRENRNNAEGSRRV